LRRTNVAISNCAKNSNTADAKKKLETKAKTKRKGRGSPLQGRPLKRVFRFEQKIEELVELNAEEDRLEHIYEDMGVTQVALGA
jgi:hypothetical protein